MALLTKNFRRHFLTKKFRRSMVVLLVHNNKKIYPLVPTALYQLILMKFPANASSMRPFKFEPLTVFLAS
jgi:hypothetical protein